MDGGYRQRNKKGVGCVKDSCARNVWEKRNECPNTGGVSNERRNSAPSSERDTWSKVTWLGEAKNLVRRPSPFWCNAEISGFLWCAANWIIILLTENSMPLFGGDRFFFPLQERQVDQKIVAEVCSLRLDGATPERVAMAVQRRNKRADIRVAYELLLDGKKAKLRKEGRQTNFPV